MSGRWFLWHPKGGGGAHPINHVVFLSYITTRASRLNTSYGLETLYVQLPRPLRITLEVFRHFKHFWQIHDFINVEFLLNFAVFGYDKCDKVLRNS